MKRVPIFVGLRCMLVGLTLALGACAFSSDTPIQTFEFNALDDSPDVEILDYQYGNSRLPGVRPSADALQTDRVGQRIGVSGAMLRGDFLYVKWRIRKTGQVYEDRADLRHRLPKNLDHCRIHFVVDGTQLYIYVISPERVSGFCPEDDVKAYKDTRPQRQIYIDYCSQKITQVYPDRAGISNSAE